MSASLLVEIPDPKVYGIVVNILDEAIRAFVTNPPMHSLHEGYAILLEEMDELKTEVWKNPRKHPDRNERARKEAIQVAAMALRLLHDVL
jgi:hypothetical protein